MTYEDKAEADFMSSLHRGRTGQLENTTFAILDPTGKQKLTATGRGPFFEYRDSRDMAQGMKKISAKYKAKTKPGSNQQLPTMKSLEVALNVGASDSIPVIILVAKEGREAESLTNKMLPLAWHSKLAGQYIFVCVSESKTLKPISGLKTESSILVVEPGQFGLSGKVLAQFDSDFDFNKLEGRLMDIAANYSPVKMSHNEHVRLGIKLGIDWKSEIPETDQQSLRAKERIRGK